MKSSTMSAELQVSPVHIVGRYALYDAIAAGGMATVHIGRLTGAVGFVRTVAIKRLHPQYARDPEFVSMFVDEARLAARIRHPNVVQTLDIVSADAELFLVMEYIQGESLSKLMQLSHRKNQRVPLRIAAALMSGALHGLHAAHETRDDHGKSLGLVHRDVSPQNILVGADGLARVLDFGVARAAGRVHTSQVGKLKGKISYMAPELVQTGDVTRLADVYGASVILWELLTGRRLFHADNPNATLARVLAGNVPAPSEVADGLSKEFDAVVLRGLSLDPGTRYQTARDMASALEACVGVEPQSQVAAWVAEIADETLADRSERVALIERSSDVSQVSDLRAMVNDLASGSWPRGTRPEWVVGEQPAGGARPPSAATGGVRGVVARLEKSPRLAMAAALGVAAVIAGTILLDGGESDGDDVGANPGDPAPAETKPMATEPVAAPTKALDRKPPAVGETVEPRANDDHDLVVETVVDEQTTERAPRIEQAPAVPTPPKPRARQPNARKKNASPFADLGGRQ